ncbi:MAG: hypothetical protein AB7P20_03295 [Rhizobiaceae bacterium]
MSTTATAHSRRHRPAATATIFMSKHFGSFRYIFHALYLAKDISFAREKKGRRRFSAPPACLTRPKAAVIDLALEVDAQPPLLPLLVRCSAPRQARGVEKQDVPGARRRFSFGSGNSLIHE